MKTFHRLKLTIPEQYDHAENAAASEDREVIAFYASMLSGLGWEHEVDTVKAERLYRYYSRNNDGTENRHYLTKEEVAAHAEADCRAMSEEERSKLARFLEGKETAPVEFDHSFYGLEVHIQDLGELEAPPILHASREVLANWSSGDLARSVNMLEEAVDLHTS